LLGPHHRKLAPVEFLGDRSKLDDEVAGQVFGLSFAALFAPEANEGVLVVAHDYPGVRAAEGAKADLKKLMPEDAREAIGHGVRAKRSKSGAISFDLLEMEASDATIQ
jgi:hypothetical protein